MKEKELHFGLGKDIVATDEDIYCCVIGWDQGNTHTGLEQVWLVSKEKPNKRMLSAFWKDIYERSRIISVRKFKSIDWFAGGINHLYGSVIHWENDMEKMKGYIKDESYLRYNISEVIYPDHPDYPRKIV